MKQIDIKTVSYTHLDVYKRQAIAFLFASSDNPIGRPVSFPRSFAACNPAPVSYTHLQVQADKVSIRCNPFADGR